NPPPPASFRSTRRRAVRPHRLEAQDTALSRLKHGFESRWGHHLKTPVFLRNLRRLRRAAETSENRRIAPNHPAAWQGNGSGFLKRFLSTTATCSTTVLTREPSLPRCGRCGAREDE